MAGYGDDDEEEEEDLSFEIDDSDTGCFQRDFDSGEI